MNKTAFVNGVLKNAARVNAYQPGMDGTGGLCDCIGLIMGGIRLAGGTWQGTHGSNYAARNEMRSLEKIPSAAVLQPGDLVYKVRRKGENGYALPASYHNHPDQRDYYHVGMVESADPLIILHCTGVPGGIRRDHALGNWQYYGVYRGIVQQEAGPEKNYRVIGGRLKMRTGPGTDYGEMALLPEGTDMAGIPLSSHPDWVQVTWQGKEGYCMARYLQETGRAETSLPDALEEVAALLDAAAALVKSLRKTG